MLIDLTTAIMPDAQVSALANQLRLPSAYAETADGADRLRQHAEAANALIERRIGHAVLQRTVEYRVTAWPMPTCVTLPLSPVRAIQEIGVIEPAGTTASADLAQFHLDEIDGQPVLAALGATELPRIGQGQIGFIRLVVGYGDVWAAVPADLRLAASMIAAALHDHGADDALSVNLPFGALALLEPYRRLKL